MTRIGQAIHAALFVALLAPLAWGHEGEDHSQAVEPVTSAALAPRASAQSEEFELVAVLEAGRLLLYLDRYASNEPVAGAQLEVESGALKAVAQPLAPGVYALPGAGFAKPARHALVVTVQAGDSVDLLSAMLDTSAAPAAAALTKPAGGIDKRLLWAAAAGVVLVGIGLVAVRRRRQRRGGKS